MMGVRTDGWENVAIAVQDGIATVRVNRPQALNALNMATHLYVVRTEGYQLLLQYWP